MNENKGTYKYLNQDEIPEEVEKAVRFRGGKPGCVIAFFEKQPEEEGSHRFGKPLRCGNRSACWEEVTRQQMVGPETWRKAHTRKYWCWFSITQFTFLAKADFSDFLTNQGKST